MTWLNGRKLTTLQNGNDSISYKYDSNSVRTSKTVNAVEYTYEYLSGQLMHETRGEKTFDYCYDANGQLYAVSYKANSSTNAVTYYYAHNWRGDITSIYDSNGNVVANYEYDDWGNIAEVTDSNGNSITDESHIANLNPFRYRSYYYDSETGFYYLMSRYYDPVTHRFLNADGYFQSGDNILDTNMNAYCRNNPIMYSDPTGEHANNVTCGDPTCPKCNSARRAYLQTEKGMTNYNKYHGTNYIGIDYKGNFISPNDDYTSKVLSTTSTGLTYTRGTIYSIVGTGAETIAASAGVAGISTAVITPFSIASHATNPYLTDTQKAIFIKADLGIAFAGIGLAMLITAITPVGWGAAAAFALSAGVSLVYNCVTTVALSCTEQYYVEKNRKAWCIDE